MEAINDLYRVVARVWIVKASKDTSAVILSLSFSESNGLDGKAQLDLELERGTTTTS